MEKEEICKNCGLTKKEHISQKGFIEEFCSRFIYPNRFTPIKMENKEKTLSEKRKELYRQFITRRTPKQKDSLNLIFDILNEQEAEAVKKLKEHKSNGLRTTNDKKVVIISFEEIDKIFGDFK